MKPSNEYQTIKREIERDTDAEIALGVFLEEEGVDCDVFMR